jgi:hypothetical protein
MVEVIFTAFIDNFEAVGNGTRLAGGLCRY